MLLVKKTQKTWKNWGINNTILPFIILLFNILLGKTKKYYDITRKILNILNFTQKCFGSVHFPRIRANCVFLENYHVYFVNILQFIQFTRVLLRCNFSLVFKQLKFRFAFSILQGWISSFFAQVNQINRKISRINIPDFPNNLQRKTPDIFRPI